MKRFLVCSVLLMSLTSAGCGALMSALAGPPPAGTSDTAESRDLRAAARLDALAGRVDALAAGAKGVAGVASVAGPVGVGVGEAAGLAAIISSLIAGGLQLSSEQIKARYQKKNQA